MDIAGGISSLKTGIEIAQTLKDINKSFDEASFKAKIADLIEKLSEARIALVEAKETIFEKDREIDALKSLEIERRNLVEGEGGYQYRTNDVGAPIGFPMCPKCDPVDSRLIQLVENGKGDVARCPACLNEYKPVTCYLPGGGTLRDRQIGEIKRKREEMNRRNGVDLRNRSWMA
jgi:hypothetical protein